MIIHTQIIKRSSEDGKTQYEWEFCALSNGEIRLLRYVSTGQETNNWSREYEDRSTLKRGQIPLPLEAVSEVFDSVVAKFSEKKPWFILVGPLDKELREFARRDAQQTVELTDPVCRDRVDRRSK